MNLLQRPNPLWTVVAILGGMALAALAASHLAHNGSLQVESDSVRRQLDLYTQSLQQRIDRYNTLPQLLALDTELRDAVSRPLLADDVTRLNAKLEQANGASQSSTLTLIDAQGTALAASNWRDPRSNVGVNYSFRPYVQQALARGRGDFYGIGLTTGEPGYFLSQAIEDPQGRVMGIIVIKIILTALERDWLETPDVVLVSDTHGVVFLASRKEWHYRVLDSLSEAQRRELRASRQYADQPLLAARYEPLERLETGGTMTRVLDPAVKGAVLWHTQFLSDKGWTVHLLHDTQASTAAGRAAGLAAAGIWLALSLLVLYGRQHRRLSALRQRSRQELETVLQQHAQELRTAQDGIVQAASAADSGLSRNLAHLPQGVVVIDAELRLTAWNKRYLELFRFPPGLIRVGLPIEDLFRYNARRGLLGPGPVEEAIQRRLNHLRSGKPHLRESEKEDGTVLEIRGNPLPDGGFVTSYADITSYKNAARELRSLADALEHRIAERTRDLDLARRQAEKANHYKTRFVSAAVHDLLQPLNAARMYLSGLRGHLTDDTGRAYADHIHHALSAQDDILSSLLDISRMESGQLPVHIRDFALAPLMETLLREFGMLAASHGLQLRGRASPLVVRSDEALLRRILQNYLSNAVRYTRQGRILFGCRRHGDTLRIEVHDQGPGIPESLLGEIFEEFRRLDEGHGDDRGAGLGLAIVERVGRLLGHPIGVSSQLGRGSTFWVAVPIGQAAALEEASAALLPAPEPAAADTDTPLRGHSSWCIADDIPLCATLGGLLERWGGTVPWTGSADAALAAAVPGQAPHMVLLEVHGDATESLARYDRLTQRWGQSTAVVLIAAQRTEALLELAGERGWGILVKPVRPPALRALVSQMLLRRR